MIFVRLRAAQSRDHVHTFALPGARPKFRAHCETEVVRPSGLFKSVVPPPASGGLVGSHGTNTLQWKSLLLGRCPGRGSRLGFPVPCPVPPQTPLEEHMSPQKMDGHNNLHNDTSERFSLFWINNFK